MPDVQIANHFATRWIEFGLGTNRNELIVEQVSLFRELNGPSELASLY